MGKKRLTPVTHSTLTDNGFEATFAAGFSPRHGGPLPSIPREEWAAESARAETEEREWWQGNRVPVQLIVELPFWLLMPDGDIYVAYDRAKVAATVRGNYMDVSVGPMSLTSRNNVVLLGPGDELWGRHLPESIVPSQMPVYRPMKTTVTFKSEAIAGCFEAWRNRYSVAPDDRAGIRRVNRAMQYLETLATAHIPLLNKLITSYRSVSLDPYAFEVSAWDVPVWYAQHDETLVRIGLMPYWGDDTYPTVNDGRSVSPFVATTIEAVQSQANANVAPGKLELLDAMSLMYRGRFGDAVRSAVTAIEVALEAQLANLLKRTGLSETEIDERLAATRGSFFDRLAEFEQLSQKRLPGPLLHVVPYINGIRLRSELDWVRTLRHKVVHEGVRIEVLQRGPMLRAIETMTWLFAWLSWEDEHGPEDNRNYVFFDFVRGRTVYPFGYSDTGVSVFPLPTHDHGETIVTDEELIFEQYLATTDPPVGDAELLVRMSFEYLGLACEDGPPDAIVEPKLRERFRIRDKSHKAIVFCLECDELIDAAACGAIAARVQDHRRVNGSDWGVLVVVHHQRCLPRKLRAIEEAIPDDTRRVLDACGATTITALDLQLLVRGCRDLSWPVESVSGLLFSPGRQGIAPPMYRRSGTYSRFFPKHSAISVELNTGATLKLGDVIGVRLESRYHEESISSLQMNGVSVTASNGPCKVGIATQLTKGDLQPGQSVFVRMTAITR